MNRFDVRDLGTILGIWAHPDDEAFLSGGLMAAATATGQRVACVTATRGELGTGDTVAWPPGRLAATRELELRASLAALGVQDHTFLDLVDGECTVADQAAQVERLIRVIERVAPDTIVTFGPDGFTGHLDHQVVSRWATSARQAAAPDARLLYPTTTAAFVDGWTHLHDREHVFLVPGLPLRTPPQDVWLELRLDEELADRKLVALRAQATQTAALLARVGEATFRSWWSSEAFVDADTAPARDWPSWAPRATTAA